MCKAARPWMRLWVLLAWTLALPCAHAMWVTITRNEATTVYIDSAAIVKVGALRRVWLVYDLREADASGQRSVKSQVEYDCGESTYRTLSASTHGSPMGQGPVLKAMPGGSSAKPVTQDALSRQIYTFACAW